MEFEFQTLGSGSSGNAAFLRTGKFGLLIDFGLGARTLAQRLAAAGLDWSDIHAVLLTHIHEDHWKETSLAQLARRGVRFYCHPEHIEHLRRRSPSFTVLEAIGRVEPIEAGDFIDLDARLTCLAIPVSHDAGATLAYRIDGWTEDETTAWSVGYASDLGCWEDSLAEQFANVDLLALEFNHDVQLQRGSARPSFLIERVLGDEGHLSNEQAASLLQAILAGSEAGRLRQLVQLHLSQDCNRPTLAVTAAERIRHELGLDFAVHAARRETISPRFTHAPSRSASNQNA
jgi:phosphoribosyl 1,2-cyclic phosphodiesterase